MKKLTIALLLTAFLTFAVFAADGDIDTTFNTSAVQFSSQATLYKTRLGANGKIYISGVMTQLNGVSYTKAIARLNADGTTDTSFSPAIDPFGTMYDFGIAPDNKIVFAASVGGTVKIARINADGSLDTSFNGPTFDTLPEYIRSVAVQTDGKVLVGGYFTNMNGTARASLVRLNADGSVDTTFNGNLGGDGIFYVTSIVPQPDGKILIGGTFKTVSGAVHFEIARLNADGSSDTAFNQGVGTQRADSPNSVNGVNDIKLLPSGKIYFIGSALSYNGAATGEVVRLNADGTRDTSFSLAPNQVGRSGLAIQTDGKILAVGNGRNYTSGFPVIRNGITKINTDGTIDTSFSPVGIPNGRTAYSAAVQPDGKIVLVGDFATFSGVAKNAIVRLLNTDSSAPTISNPALRLADFDGDGKADASVFRNGTWFINPSTAPSLAPTSAYSVQFGLATDKLAPADYDGDGRTDIAVWRESEGNFYILNSSNNSVRVENFGLSGDVLTVGDWDGDGRADLSVYREGAQSYFFYRGSLNNPSGNITYLPFGVAGDKAVRGDFDGDGKLDAAIFRASNNIWYIRQSSNASVRYENWGLSTDKFVPSDYDGDGKTDLAVFRSGVWYVKQSSNAQILYINWGLSTDSLVAADYDGDGRADAAVWRSGVYYIRSTANGAASYQYFGTAGDKTVASAFIQ